MNVTVPDVQQALLDALEAEFDGAKQVVLFGLPTKKQTKPERFYLEADPIDLQRSQGGTYTTETYRLRVVVEVRQLGQTPADYQACSERRWTLANEAAALLRAGTFRHYLEEGRDIVVTEPGSGAIDKGFVANTRLVIPVRARA